MIEIRITTEGEQAALESLALHIPAAPTGYLRQLLLKGKVRREGIALTEAEPVRQGDRLFLSDSRRLQELLAASAAKPHILFESREILIVDKPAGLAIHRGQGHDDNLTDRLQETIRQRKEKYLLAPVHRLDAATSGAVIFGKGRQATAALGKVFMAGQVEKIYLALAAGRLPETGQLAAPVPAKGKWKAALTKYRRLAIHGDFSLLQLALHSGRTHQIRRQFADIGHPLAGDRRYRGPQPPGLERLFLHCRYLALQNPFDGSALAIECPLPAALSAFLAILPPDCRNK
ncbi:MAG: RluA family pseudouridine synthase [Desulfuromonadales bacterium]